MYEMWSENRQRYSGINGDLTKRNKSAQDRIKGKQCLSSQTNHLVVLLHLEDQEGWWQKGGRNQGMS